MAAVETYDYYLYLEGAKSGWVKGETSDVVHPNEIEVESFSWGVSNPSKSSSSTDWKPNFTDVSLTLFHGPASVIIMNMAASGAVVKKAILSARKPGSKKSGPANGDFLQMAFHNCFVSSYSIKPGATMMDEITLNFWALETFYAQQNQDGSLGDTVQRGWAIGDNKTMEAQHLPFKNPNAK